jgi:hypothetical protein
MGIDEDPEARPIDLKTTLDGLQFAQALYPTDYKLQRIIKLRKRLGIDKE